MSILTTTAPAVTHPTWCDPESCSEDHTGGYLRDVMHWTTDQVTLGAITCTAGLARNDNHDGEDDNRIGENQPYIRLAAEGDVSLDEMETFGRWLLARAAGYRAAIAAEVPTQRSAR